MKPREVGGVETSLGRVLGGNFKTIVDVEAQLTKRDSRESVNLVSSRLISSRRLTRVDFETKRSPDALRRLWIDPEEERRAVDYFVVIDSLDVLYFHRALMLGNHRAVILFQTRLTIVDIR